MRFPVDRVVAVAWPILLGLIVANWVVVEQVPGWSAVAAPVTMLLLGVFVLTMGARVKAAKGRWPVEHFVYVGITWTLAAWMALT